MRGSSLASAGLVLVAVGVLLAGCTASGPRSAPTTSAAEPVSPTTAPPSAPATTAAAVPTTDPDDPDTWLVSDSGVGPAILGVRFDDIVAAMPTGTAVQAGCEWAAFWMSADLQGQFIAARDRSDTAGAVREVVWLSTDPAASAGRGPRTAEGIGVGSSLSEVRDAYPTATDVPVRNYATGLRVGDVWFASMDEQVVWSIAVTTSPPSPEFCL